MTRFRILLSVETSHGFGRSVIDGATRYIVEQDGVIEFEQPRLLESLPHWLDSWKGHGILIRSDATSIRRFLKNGDLPAVQLYCVDSSSEYDVGVDEKALGEMAVEFFLGQGHRNFASLLPCGVPWASLRWQGFVDALQRRGLSCSTYRGPDHFTRPLVLWKEKDYFRMVDWLKKLPKPAALFTLTDVYSRRITDLCLELGIDVPEHIAVLGVDNDDWLCRYQVPTLSSIDQNGYRIGYEGAVLLYKMIRSETCPKRPILIPPIGVVPRMSTDMPVVDDKHLFAALCLIRRCGIQSTVEEVVRKSGLSRRTLERRFRKHFGRTIGQEINRIRLESAASLLRETQLPIGGIARRCGFGTHGYFVAAFQRLFLLTPSEYRRQFSSFS